MPVAGSADSQKCRHHQRALEMGPDASARKQRERELAWKRKRHHWSCLTALYGSQEIKFHPALCSTPIPRTDYRCERDRIQQRRSRNNQIQNDVSSDPFDDTVLAPLHIPYVPLHQVEGVCARCAREVCYPICLIDLFIHLSVSLYAEKRSLL